MAARNARGAVPEIKRCWARRNARARLDTPPRPRPRAAAQGAVQVCGGPGPARAHGVPGVRLGPGAAAPRRPTPHTPCHSAAPAALPQTACGRRLWTRRGQQQAEGRGRRARPRATPLPPRIRRRGPLPPRPQPFSPPPLAQAAGAGGGPAHEVRLVEAPDLAACRAELDPVTCMHVHRCGGARRARPEQARVSGAGGPGGGMGAGRLGRRAAGVSAPGAGAASLCVRVRTRTAGGTAPLALPRPLPTAPDPARPPQRDAQPGGRPRLCRQRGLPAGGRRV